MRSQIYTLMLFLVGVLSIAVFTSKTEARRGCCSRHGGVCGCACCDGTPLSDKCAPYYPKCKSTPAKPAAKKNTVNVDKKDGQKAYVVKVIDGDTIKVRILPSAKVVDIRILGIDCPESHKNRKCTRDGRQGRKGCDWQIPRGLRASKRAAELLKARSIYLECDGGCKNGSYGRPLRYVRLENSLDFGLKMVRLGLCEDFSWKYPHPRMREYKKVQEEAKAEGKGIWELKN